jgi:hypothetical protein
LKHNHRSAALENWEFAVGFARWGRAELTRLEKGHKWVFAALMQIPLSPAIF